MTDGPRMCNVTGEMTKAGEVLDALLVPKAGDVLQFDTYHAVQRWRADEVVKVLTEGDRGMVCVFFKGGHMRYVQNTRVPR